MTARVPRLISLGALFASGVLTQDCDYSRDHCIKAQASASVKLEFEPLFTSPPTFVFAIDDMEDQDIQDMLNDNNNEFLEAPGADDPAQAVAFWLEYDNGTVNYDSRGRKYSVWAMESNSANDVGGADGGCEDLLGAQCVGDLKSLFTGVGDNVNQKLADFYNEPPDRINCPTVLWNDGRKDRGLFSGASRPLSANGAEASEPLTMLVRKSLI